MTQKAVRKLVLSATLLMIFATPASRIFAESTPASTPASTPNTSSVVASTVADDSPTGTDPEPKGNIVEILLDWLLLA